MNLDETKWQEHIGGGLCSNESPTEVPRLLSIGLPLIAKGFRLTPVSPQTKCGVLHNWTRHQATTVEKLQEYSTMSKGKYADHNLGVVGKRGVGRDMFLDCDAAGVAERIESDTGRKMPETYIVQSRPESAPWKKHFYLKQTEYSFRAFAVFGTPKNGAYDPWGSVNINVKDLSVIDDEGKHPTLYDVKGIGGGSLVVAAGSIRENGEIYTAVDPDAPVLPIPNWLVDWLVADIKKYRIGNQAELKAKHEAKNLCRQQYTAKERAELRKQNLPDGFDICQEDVYWFIRWRAGSFASLGLEPNDIEHALAAQVRKFCQGGVAFVESEKGRETIHKVAHDPDLVQGDASFFYDRRNDDPVPIKGALILQSKAPKVDARRELILSTIQELPKGVTADEAYARIERSLAKEGHKFNRSLPKDQCLVCRLRKQAGFRAHNEGGKFVWVRC